MTYAATETSKYLNSPIEIYEFNQKNVEIYRYTSADKDVLYAGFTYEKISLKRGDIEQSQQISRSTLKIDMPRSIPLVTQFVAQPPSNVINLTIRRFHRLDIDNEVVVLWKGRLANVDFKGDVCQLICDPLITAMRRTNLRRLFQISCPHILYRGACGIDEVTYRQNATLTVVDNINLTSTTFGTEADGYWSGGIVRIEKSGMPHVRAIITHVGNVVEIDLSIPGLVATDVVQAAPGCDRNISTCVSKFSNEDNFGGYPYIPIKNPMGAGVPIW